MDLKVRVSRFKELLVKEGVDALFISDPANIIYLTNFTNVSAEERDVYLLITKNSQYFLTDGRYIEAVQAEVKHFKAIERSPKEPTSKILGDLKKKHHIEKLGVEEFDLKVTEYKSLKKIFPKMKPIVTYNLRQIKDQFEVDKIEAACDLADQAILKLLSKVKEGVSEKELALEFELFLMHNQARISFDTIVAFGKNASIPHYQTAESKLTKKGQFILIDCGAKLNQYCSDMSRTYFYGEPDAKQQLIYQTVLQSQTQAVEFLTSRIKKGESVTAEEVDQIATNVIKMNGFDPYSHALGHGIGLQVHESPVISSFNKRELVEGMVFSIEPGIYLPGFGGVRIEDLYLIEKRGVRQLTKSPKILKVL